MDQKLLDQLNQFISIEKEVRAADTVDELGFHICNLTKRTVRYHQAIFWTYKNGMPFIQTVSGTAGFETDSPYIQWLRRLVKEISKKDQAYEQHAVKPDDLSDGTKREGKEYTPEHILWSPFVNAKNQLVGGMIFFNDNAWKDYEAGVISELSEVYLHAYQAIALRKDEKKWQFLTNWKSSKKKIAVISVIILILLFPIQISVLAPAEIVPKDPLYITSPLNGVVEKIHVEPNQHVKKGDLLFELDATELRNKFKIAESEHKIAQEKLRKANQFSFSNEESKSELFVLEAEVEIKRLERDYLKYLLDRVQVHATEEGIVIYNDKNEWIGKPVNVGERIMELADEQKKQLNIHLPVSDGLVFDKESDIRLFLDAYPLNPLAAKLTYASFKSTQTPDQQLAYLIKGDFTQESEISRIGLKGTAKIYAHRVVLIYYLLRKPISYVRQNLGI